MVDVLKYINCDVTYYYFNKMKYIKYLLLCLLACMSCCIYAQTFKDSVDIACLECESLYKRICPENRLVFGEPECLAQFPGGEKELMIFLRNNVEYPLECKEKNIQGYVVVQFIIDEYGKIICPRIRRNLHPTLDKEAFRVVKLMPDWEPASNDGIPCKACFSLPIFFK